MSDAFTFYFKDILPTYDDFKNYLSDISLSYSVADEDIIEYIYYLIYYRYCLSNVRYTSKEAFLYEFAIRLKNELKRYIKRYKLIQSALSISDDEIIELGRAIQNFANNPNDEISDPISPLSYISSQTFQATLNNKLNAYVKAIEDIPDNYNEEFLYRFSELFMNIIPQRYPIYIKEEE